MGLTEIATLYTQSGETTSPYENKVPCASMTSEWNTNERYTRLCKVLAVSEIEEAVRHGAGRETILYSRSRS